VAEDGPEQAARIKMAVEFLKEAGEKLRRRGGAPGWCWLVGGPLPR
jgi:hypothetical protein